jgi:Ca2+-binding RTX toxin-like protein
MTTYTIPGISLGFSPTTGDLISVASSSFTIVAADADDSFSYTSLGITPGDDFPTVEITNNDAYNIWLDGSAFNGMAFETLIGQVTWGSGNLAYLLDFYDPATTINYLFQLGGTPLPNLTTVAEFEAFQAGATLAAATGAYAPGSTITFDSLTGVSVTENDIIQGDASRNVYYGGVGRDRIYGEGGRDKLFGDTGNDRLWGGNKDDRLSGGDGNDRLNGGNGADALFGGKGRDELKGAAGNDSLSGGSGSDLLSGGAGRDWLSGGKNLDVLQGGKGADVLLGGKGNDDMWGGAGADVFLYSGAANEGGDVIFDFRNGADLIRIGGTVGFLDVTITGAGGDTFLSWNSTMVTLFGVDSSLITIDDFDFV